MQIVYLDANIILRFLLGDDPKMFEEARSIFKSAEQQEISLMVDPVTLAKCCSFLAGQTARFPSKKVVTDALTKVLFLPGVQAENPVALVEALEIYAHHDVDFADAYLAVIARNQACSVASFNENLRQSGVEVFESHTH
ncbi:PIN domain-containing protein [Alicyclobacillus kakegawensis]|uniref:PIN domain-containing protein n=1 Tax=Alicyclobacillus kakegawensis TaxID=392012 RepID=UPI000830A466|nr:PIN domain-containing protein [Alicyclobacillus kakegawensis]